jgi:putative acetyltransferase
MSEAAIVIRAARPDDAPAAMTAQVIYVTDAEWQQRVTSDAQNRILVAEIDEQVVGNVGLHLMTRRRAHCAGLGMAVREEFRGRGVGSALLDAIIDLADNWYNIVRLELQVYTDNEPAVRLYARRGFVIEGTHLAYVYRLGEFVDAYTMARLRNPPQLRLD